jgi:cytochrome c-type biogenesis protein CcmH/NrfG
MPHVKIIPAVALLVLFGVAVAQAAPNEAIKLNNFGSDLVKQGRLEEAVNEFRRAVELDPGFASAQANLAYTLDRLNRAEEATAAYQKAIALDGKNATVLNNLGVLYTKKGQYDEAIQTLEQGEKVDPTNATLKKNLENARKNKALVDEREARIAEARKLVDAHPNDARTAYQLARVYASFDMQDPAFEWLGKALQLGFDNIQFVREDPVLAGLRGDPRYASLLKDR